MIKGLEKLGEVDSFLTVEEVETYDHYVYKVKHRNVLNSFKTISEAIESIKSLLVAVEDVAKSNGLTRPPSVDWEEVYIGKNIAVHKNRHYIVGVGDYETIYFWHVKTHLEKLVQILEKIEVDEAERQ